MTNDSLISEQPGMRRLRAWNPLDHLRLLWWVLFAPGQLVAYWAAYGENTETKLWAWWSNTFRWVPFFLYSGFKGDFFTGVIMWFASSLMIINLPQSIGRVARSCWLSVFSSWMLLACLKLDAPWIVLVLLFIPISCFDIIINQDVISNNVNKHYKNIRISWIVWLGFIALIVTCCIIISVFPSLL